MNYLKYFTKLINVDFMEAPIITSIQNSADDCAFTCLQTAGFTCTTFRYFAGNRTCSLFSSGINSDDVKKIIWNVSGSNIYSLKGKSHIMNIYIHLFLLIFN